MNCGNLQNVFGDAHPVAVVTGAGAPRVGRAVAETLHAAGYRIVVHANSSIERAKEVAMRLSVVGPDAIALPADLSDEGQARWLIRESHEHFGRIDALVHTAAIWAPKPLEAVTADDVRRSFDVNTLSAFVLSQAVGLIMAGQASGGAIVNFGDWGIARPYPDYAAYFPSKGAIPTLTRSLAVELAERNRRVRVNAILPGPVLLAPDTSENRRESAIESTLLKRVGTPEHVAHAVRFLLENDFVTGICLPVDGGRTIYAPFIDPS